MNNSIRCLTASVALLALAGCAGRTPNPTTVSYGTDSIQSCQTLESEVRSNAATAQAKITSNQSRDAGDGAIAVGSILLFPPALLAMDLSNADGVEGNALLDRNERLKQIAITKGCDVSHYPNVVRYW